MTLGRLFFVLAISFWYAPITWAEETDQFTLPPTELFDIGPATSAALYETIERVVMQTNTEMRSFEARASRSRYATKQLALRRNESYLVNLLYRHTGPGFPRWLRSMRLPAHNLPDRFKEIKPWNTIYWLVFSQSPMVIIGLAPTINMYHYYFGTDKLGHFFMQGHTYYSIYSFYINHGKSAQQAHDAIILYGQILEQTYLGTLVNGVYSNGDLSSNYAGWKFYMNLGHSIKIGDKILPPILELKNNQWQIAKWVGKSTLLKPYLTDNMSEAWNPSRYSFMRGQIRKHVKARCPEWIKRRGLTQRLAEEKLQETKLWHGENYGHWLPKSNEVTLNLCFAGN